MTVILDAGSGPTFSLHQEQSTTTDSTGRYRFDLVTPGVHFISTLDTAGHWPTTSLTVYAEVELHQTVPVNFGFYRLPVILHLPLILGN